LNYFRVRPRTWSQQDGWAPADASVRKFLQIMDNPENYPVLVHCFAGCHRTGTYIAAYRMEFEHWTKAEALAEIRQAGSDVGGSWDVLKYLEQYRPRQTREVSAGAEEAEAEIPRCWRQ
jgi:tyrosine-protein phosphatase SIW14